MERRLFHQLFATVSSLVLGGKSKTDVGLDEQKDQKIGMHAFANKQKPAWSNE